MAGAAGSKTARKKKTPKTKHKHAIAKAKTKATRRATKKTTGKPATRTPTARPSATAKTAKTGKSSEVRVRDEILSELRSLRSLLESPPTKPASADEVLDDSVLSLRRLLSELMERRMEAVTATLADLRASLSSGEADLQRATAQLDRLLDDLGVIRFDAEAMDYPDPLIHAVVAQRSDPSAPDGVVLETRNPGFRAGGGVVLAKARVVVNRRS